MNSYYDKDGITIYHGDCLEIMPQLDQKFDAIITDPPYPGYHKDKWKSAPIEFLMEFDCQQLIFWSAILKFPLDYTAVHIWDKKINAAASSEYERIFERNGKKLHRVFNHYFINSTVAASYNGDIFTGHPSQKPIALMEEIIKKLLLKRDLICDPFMGSGSTLKAAKNSGLNAIGIESNQKWCQTAVKRLEGFSRKDIENDIDITNKRLF